jgi:hypothetical protein
LYGFDYTSSYQKNHPKTRDNPEKKEKSRKKQTTPNWGGLLQDKGET